MVLSDLIKQEAQYSMAEAAELLGVHRNTLRNYVKSGALRCRYRRHNRRPFFMGNDLIMFTKAQY